MDYRFATLAVAALMVVSCKQTDVSGSATADSGMVAEDSVETLFDANVQERIEADPKLGELREAGMKLAEHVRLDGNTYVLDISEEDAAKLGVSSENYRYHVNELKKTNDMIAAAIARGDSIELPDVRELMNK